MQDKRTEQKFAPIHAPTDDSSATTHSGLRPNSKRKLNASQFLQEHGIKPTRQRTAIAAHIFEQEQHLSADAILDRVNSDLSTTNVSKATVYNTLKLFVKQGILKEVAIDPQRILFDTNTHQHHHVMDMTTGEIRDIDPVDVDLTKITGLKSNESIQGVELLIKVRSD